MDYLIGKHTPDGIMWYCTDDDGHRYWRSDVNNANRYETMKIAQRIIELDTIGGNAIVFAICS